MNREFDLRRTNPPSEQNALRGRVFFDLFPKKKTQFLRTSSSLSEHKRSLAPPLFALTTHRNNSSLFKLLDLSAFKNQLAKSRTVPTLSTRDASFTQRIHLNQDNSGIALSHGGGDWGGNIMKHKKQFTSIYQTSILLSFSLSLAACSGEYEWGDEYDEATEIGVSTQGTILGTNDLIQVNKKGTNIDEKYRPLLDAFARTEIEGKVCTATHIGNGLVLSAGHCFDAGTEREDWTSCDGQTTTFSFRVGNIAPITYCKQIITKQKGNGYDYALYRINRTPSAAIPVHRGPSPALNTKLTMFGHPGGRPLEWSNTCDLLFKGSPTWHHDCDSEGGSSGSAMLLDDSLEVVGIHWGGSVTYNVANALQNSPIYEHLNIAHGHGARLRARHSNLCLELTGGSTANGSTTQQNICDDTEGQDFQVQLDNDGYAKLIHTASQKCLTVEGGSLANAAAIVLQPCTNSSFQEYTVENVGSGYVKIINRGSGKAVEVFDALTSPGTRVQQYAYGGAPQQEWKIIGNTCGGVVVHDLISYGGTATVLAPGNYPLLKLNSHGVLANSISSLQVPAGCSVELFENDNYGGASLVKTTNDSSLIDDAWDNRTVSLRVR